MASDVTKTAPLPFAAPAAAEAPKPSAPQPSKQPAQPGKSFADELASSSQSGRPDRADKRERADKPDAVKAKLPVEGKDAGPTDKVDAKDNAEAKHGKDDKTSKKQDLRPLKQAANTNKKAIADAPAVAVLSGQLDKVQASDIPALLSENSFLTGALGDADLSAFMDKPTSIGDMIEALDLPPAVAEEAEKLGLDLSAAVSPNDFLRNIGLDPQRVFAQLKGLKDTLLAGGVDQYMQRADALAGRDSISDMPLTDDRLDLRSSSVRSTAPGAIANAPMPTTPGFSLQPSATQQSEAPRPAELATDIQNLIARLGQLNSSNAPRIDVDLDEGVDLESLSPASLAVLSQMGAFSPVALVKDQDPSALIDDEAGMPKIDGIGSFDGDAIAAATDDAIAAATDDAQLPDAEKLGAAPSLKKGTFDAWAELGARLRGADAQAAKFDGQLRVDGKVSALQSGLSLEEQLMRGQVTTPAPSAATPALGLAASTSVAAAQANLNPAREASIDSRLFQQMAMDARVEARDARGEVMQSPRMAPGILGAALMSKDGLVKIDQGTFSVDDLRLVAPTLDARLAVDGSQGRDQRGDDTSEQRDDRGSDLGQSAGERFASVTHLGSARKSEGTFAHALQTAETPELTTAQRADLVQRVLDRATTVSHAGGGTVRMDLSSPELGHLEMAIKMNEDNKLEMRIMTASDRVRDAMMAELSSLRDALAVQNVQLGKVDVGVNGRNPQQAFAGFAGNSQQQRSQNPMNDGNSGDRRPSARPELMDRLASVRRPAMSAMAAVSSYNNNGRLAIRA